MSGIDSVNNAGISSMSFTDGLTPRFAASGTFGVQLESRRYKMFDSIPYIPYTRCFNLEQSVATSGVQNRIENFFPRSSAGDRAPAIRTLRKASLLNSFGAAHVWHFDCDCTGTARRCLEACDEEKPFLD
jgi:hypothetical protein